MTVPTTLPISGCTVVPVRPNRDARGCLYEVFRENWQHAFRTVQWNACVSRAGVIRGVHVHADYDEFYTLPQGRVVVGLHDIRRSSQSFGRGVQFDWSQDDNCAIVIPRGVAHVLYFYDDSVLVFGLSRFWRAEYDVLGCVWDDPELGFKIPVDSPNRSDRDASSGDYREMILAFEQAARQLLNEPAHQRT